MKTLYLCGDYMKKIISLLLLIVLIFSLSGCNKADSVSSEYNVNNSNKSQNKANTSIDVLEPFELNSISYEIKLEELKNIVDYDFYRKLFITNDGSLNKIGKFSDGTKLKKISENLNLIKFRAVSTIIDKNNLLYSYDDKNLSISFRTQGEKNYLNYAYIIFNPERCDAVLTNNKIYLKQIENFNFKLPENAIYNFADDEIVELFIDGTIKTNKGYYYFKQTINHSEYDDVPNTTTYSLEKITVLDDDIIFIKYYENKLCIVDNSGHLKIYNNVKY